MACEMFGAPSTARPSSSATSGVDYGGYGGKTHVRDGGGRRPSCSTLTFNIGPGWSGRRRYGRVPWRSSSRQRSLPVLLLDAEDLTEKAESCQPERHPRCAQPLSLDWPLNEVLTQVVEAASMSPSCAFAHAETDPLAALMKLEVEPSAPAWACADEPGKQRMAWRLVSPYAAIQWDVYRNEVGWALQKMFTTRRSSPSRAAAPLRSA